MSLGKPARLERVFQIYDPPIYFVTLCTAQRRRILANERVHRTLVNYGERGQERDVALGRYAIMPDHIHLFVRGSDDFNLGIWVRGLKRVVAAAVIGGRFVGVALGDVRSAAVTAAATTAAVVTKVSIWQRGFFDHVLRNKESYSEKWEYVAQNPVRAGLVERFEDWPYAGEIVQIDRV